MSEITALQPMDRTSTSLQRRKPRRFTLAYKIRGNGALSVVPLAALVAASWIAAMLGVYGLVSAAALIAIVGLASMAALEHVSHWGNAALKEACRADLQAHSPELLSHSLGFVGLSTPGYLWQWGWLDTHEDVGMLCAADGQLLYRGDQLDLAIPRRAITAIQMRTDPFFSWIGLRWIRIDYQEAGQTSSIYIQSRDKNRLSQQPSSNRALLERLQSWWRGSRALHSG